MFRKQRGFTTVELLVVVACVAILAAVGVPMYGVQMEKARQAADLANMRSAYAAASMEWLSRGGVAERQVWYFDGSRVTTEAGEVGGYGQSARDAAEFGGDLPFPVSGVPNSGGRANYLVVEVDTEGVRRLYWSAGGGFTLLNSLRGIEIQSGAGRWYRHSPEREASFRQLRALNTQAERKASDLDVLDTLAAYFRGMSADKALSILGERRFRGAYEGGSVQTALFSYGQDISGSVYFKNFGTDFQPYLGDLGFHAQVYRAQTKQENRDDKYYAFSDNCVDRYLFTSDEMLGAVYRSGVLRQVCLGFRVEGGLLADVSVYVKDLTDAGFVSKR